MSEIVLMADPRVASIPVVDNGEPLVDLRLPGSLRLDSRKADANGSYAHLRAGVVQRLERAQAALPDNLGLLIIEGFRPPALQRHYFDEYLAELRALHPDLSASELNALATRYVSPPGIAPHSSGAAVDLTLCDGSGNELDLGTRVNASPEESDGRCYTDADGLPPEAQANRDILTSALVAAGLVNYPTEWWHWSYGDRYWALAAGEATALYRPMGELRPSP
jgi:D-alanyl-D-alanine dipeptidase